MLKEATPARGVMESGGSYNQHAKVQADGGTLALPLLEKAAACITIESGSEPVVIADYGSSQGKNSLAPMRTAIRTLRARLKPDRPICVVHVDQPANDFNTLFDVLHQEPERYALNDANVFPSAVGRSFYEQVFPSEYVHLGWSSYAAMWLSRIPTQVTGHFRADRGTEAEIKAFRRQAAEDWERFLSLRARELRPKGSLVVALAAFNDEVDCSSGYEDLMDLANAVFGDMVSEGTISREERERMVLGSWLRQRRDLLAPFERDGRFRDLTVECCELSRLSDPAWVAYEHDGNKEALATSRARLFRATFAPSLACALTDAAKNVQFADRLEVLLKQRLINQTKPMHSFVQSMVLTKKGGVSIAVERRENVDLGAEKSEGQTLGAMLHSQALKNPKAIALYCGDRKMSYEELDDSSSRLARWLMDQGLQQGDRVAIHWCNSIETVQLFFAIFKAGLIAVPINLRLKAPEVAWILEHSQARLCFSEPNLAPIAEETRAGCPSLSGILTQLPALGTEPSSPPPQVEADEPAFILYTSGTTARPKGATHSHRTGRAAGQLIAGNLLADDDVVLIMTQVMHSLGVGILLGALYRGIPAVLLPAFEPGAFLDTVGRFRCTFSIGLPALMQMIVEEQAVKPRDTSSLRTALGGGDSVPPKLQERFAALFGVPLQEAIGMTETFPIAFNPKSAIRPGSVGVALPGVRLALVDPDGEHLRDGETGELVVQSPVNCLGYWNDPAATEELLRGSWLHTGDLAMRDADGYFWFKGRRKEIIVHGGSNVSPQEVEEVLYQHPAVFEAGVVGAPDAIYGELVVAFVSLRNGDRLSEEELRKYAGRSLAEYKVPKKIFFVPELPKGATGKVHRSTIKTWLRDKAL
jgi:long-chain acyl-CoA synthetase